MADPRKEEGAKPRAIMRAEDEGMLPPPEKAGEEAKGTMKTPLSQSEHVIGSPSPEERDTPLKADMPTDVKGHDRTTHGAENE